MKTIAFLGLGTMGLPMAANLLRAGYVVRAWNRSPAPLGKLAALGAQAAASPAEAAAGADALVSMLADDAATRYAVLEAGALAALAPARCTSTWPPCRWRWRPSWRGCMASAAWPMAAPVLGRVNVAEAGQLNILAAGEARALLAVQPLFDAMGRKTWYFGERPEQANAVKLAVNFMIGSAIGAMSEAVALVRGYDVDKAAFLEMATSTAFAAPVYQGYGQAIAEALRAGRLQAGAGPEGPAPGAGSGRAGARAAATGRRAARCAHREPGARRGPAGLGRLVAHAGAAGRAGVRRRGEPLLIRRAPRAPAAAIAANHK